MNVYGLPAVIMVIGVNGVERPSIGKLANMYKNRKDRYDCGGGYLPCRGD